MTTPTPTGAPRFLRTRDAARLLGVAETTLEKWRRRGDGPLFAKASNRMTIYDMRDIEAWLASRKRTSTSDPAPLRPDAGERRPRRATRPGWTRPR